MSQRSLTPDRLFDRPWQPGHPFRPRLSSARRWVMMVVLFLLCVVIGAYWYITDSRRVKGMAEQYLTSVLGGPVKVGKANLSLFEGLRLDDVEVRVDEGEPKADSVIFSARSFEIKPDLRQILSGRLEAQLIRAIQPHVRLTENLDTGQWNYKRLARIPAAQPVPKGKRPMVLPEIILRDAQLDYSEIRDGKYISLGSMAIEGRLSPGGEAGRYTFNVQSRGQTEGIGPMVSGSINVRTGQVAAKLKNFEFDRDIRTMLPAQVRDWWQRHELYGRLDIPELFYNPPTATTPATFKVETDLNSVTLSVRPEEWLSRDENARLLAVREMWALMRDAGLNRANPALEAIAAAASPAPVRLNKCSGVFVFTEDGIDIKDMYGRVEANAFQINGRIDGYKPDSPATIKVSSPQSENIYIPHAPQYVSAMPRPVREIYDRLKPEGTCSFWVEVKRPEPGKKMEVSGEVKILDGNFVFDRFPYPVRKATGRILFGRDPVGGMERVEIADLRGLGVVGGPNENSEIHVNGWIGPFTNHVGVNVRVQCDSVTNEPILHAAFPKEVRQALRIFDPEDKGNQPKFHGKFLCDVIRPIGPRQPWTINTDITLDDASGALVAFPYPLEKVTADLKVRNGYVDIINAKMVKGDASLVIDGRVSWGKGSGVRVQGSGKTGSDASSLNPEPSTLNPDLKLTAKSVSIDSTLLNALPPDKRIWLERIGVGGKLDIDGKIFAQPHKEKFELGYDLGLTLREGVLWPMEGTFVISNVEGSMRLGPDRLDLVGFSGKRENAKLSGKGVIAWPENRPKIEIDAAGEGLALDAALYGLLPSGARAGWDAVQPEGTIDATLKYHGAIGRPTEGASDELKRAHSYEVTLTPRKLAVTPKAVPYRMDGLKGVVHVTPDKVTLQDISGGHGDAKITLSGEGDVSTSQTAWEMRMNATNLPVDDEFRKALPTTLRGLAQSLKLKGKLDVQFSKLAYRPGKPAVKIEDATASSIEVVPPPTTAPAAEPEPDIDFACKITPHGAAMDVGLQLAEVNGTVDLTGEVRSGRLSTLTGQVDLASLTMSTRPAKNFRAELSKPADQPVLSIAKMQAELVGGEMAGNVDLTFPEDSTGSYALNLVLRNARVQDLTGETDHDINGELNASLALQGNWSDPTSRRGRGDVTVEGKKMYKMPLVLGLLQITNLALPLSGPFNHGSARYSVEGQRVTFEDLSLQSDNVVMQGHGHLDFESKKVRMSFTTDSANWPKLPVVGEILQGARQELLQIHVRGTLQEPKVSASAMNTFQTTVDEVFNGGEPEEK